MGRFLTILVMEACAVTCAVTAGILAFNGIEGWGWFLFVAVMTTVTSAGQGNKQEETP